ncbi:endonuclease/exonuclease/phosphatase family protein [Maridesulfovibrio sp.]|uniref:endonuclease/exonuclease/phosphatase family protein n=1 Tax=Maridesulfovibrio sp. TaxID=2795000 RepID=UPI003AFFB027
MYTLFKVFAAVFLFVVILVAGYFLIKWFSAPDYSTGQLEQGQVLKFDLDGESGPAANESLRVMSYNLGFAAGPMQHSLADDHPESFFISNLDKFIDLVRAEQANIVLLQEVDIHSKRSWYMNQLEYVMERLGWGYAAPVVDWDMYFPLRREHKITKATVVLSRFPILSNEYTQTASKSNFESMLLNIFYYPLLWKSTMQRVGIDLGDKRLDIYNVHLCVWTRAARVAQVKFLSNWINKSSTGNAFILGGDFNFQAYIRGTPKPMADLAKPPFLDVLWQDLSGVSEILSEKGDSADNIHKNYTFEERKHRYDFLYYSRGLNQDEGKVIRNINVSDHFPVFGSFNFRSE